jgi:putative ABC transport system permease protein
LDAATATYSLHVSESSPTFDVTSGRGQTIRLKVVGVLPESIFQGDVLMSEEALLEHFPDVSGFRFFLIEAGTHRLPVARARRQATQGNGSSSETAIDKERAKKLPEVLERALGDYGLAVETTGQRLARFLVVQNTYLSTFQSLGGLGLLLGTFGLAAVQLRNVLQRRRELALLRATGFRRRALAWMVILENALLLVAGLGCGVLAALVAVLPHVLLGGASIPWVGLGSTLLAVLAVGLIAGLAAVRAVLAAPLLPALRGE